MQVFISWSGRQSEHVATALRIWLPKVLDGKVKPFVSSEDIDKGDRGLNKIAEELEGSSYGIVVVTPSNQDSPWINFEAGALGKSVSDARVAPLLVGLTDSDVKGPIKQFQNSAASDKKAVLSLVRSLNKALKDPLGDGTVEVLFEAHWQEMAAAISGAPNDASALPQKPRAESDLLDEVLTTVRSLQRDVGRMQKMMELSTRASREDFTDEVADILMKGLSLNSLSFSHDQTGGITVDLPDDAGVLSGVVLRRLQEAARRNSSSVTIVRQNGASVAYDSAGIESRVNAPEEQSVSE
ncbi:toll/interleukin-1 receptor domain-containing protein [Arthrobacter phoenicis]|uniref:toll/interleukin-1 receptor domain-containing protein n=1 Tax=Arthrobacter sp. 1P10PA TaxID=3132263 RepID=UPI0039A2CBCD